MIKSATSTPDSLQGQNDQLWKIIEKQRLIIQNLQKDLTRMTAEKDQLQNKVEELEKKAKLPTLSLNMPPDDEVDSPSSPVPPPRSPYRQNTTKERSQLATVESLQIASPEDPEIQAPRESTTATTDSDAQLFAKYHQSSRPSRDSMLPPARLIPEHDVSLRAASPPPPRSGYRSPSPVDMPQYVHDSIRESTLGMSDYEDLPTPPPKASSHGTTPPPSSSNNIFSNEMIAGICIKVTGSNITTNEKGKEVVSFIISVGKRLDSSNGTDTSEDEMEELWRVEKLYSDFLALDTKIKASEHRAVSSKLGKLPDKALFATHAPSKVDQRKRALEQYLKLVISLPLKDVTDLCEFLSTNVIEQEPETASIPGYKEGYLTKRGKNFGGWKTRYFVLNGPILRYYETKDGHHLGSIRLTDAQIGRQQSNTNYEPHESSNNAYRHAFLILEPKKTSTNGVARHVLCADSDDERDEWVEALIQYVGIKEEQFTPSTPRTSRDRDDRKKAAKKIRKVSKDEIVPISAAPISQLMIERNEKLMFASGAHRSPSDSSLPKDDTSSPKTPTPGTPSTPNDSLSSSIPTNSPLSQTVGADQQRASLDQNYSYFSHSAKTVTRRSSMIHLSGRDGDMLPQNETRSETSSPVAGGKSSSEQAGEELDVHLADKKAKQKSNRMTFWGKKMFNSSSADQYASNGTSLGTGPRPSTSTSTSTPTQSQGSSGLRGFLSRSSNESPSDRPNQDRKKKGGDDAVKRPAKQVFGVPLEVAVNVSPAAEGYDLPSVVFRCIEYLDAKDAASEEGIYRLSGSSAVIKGLKEKFNTDGDFDILGSKQYYDVHAVAGLLKLWLRELPNSVLTKELLMDFLHTIDLLDRRDRVNELGRLVSMLPLPNYTLLRALTAHLIRVVQNSDVNKMTMRNVGIVFSPTLGIPAGIFNLFLSEFDYIFWTSENNDETKTAEEVQFLQQQEVFGAVQQQHHLQQQQRRKQQKQAEEEQRHASSPLVKEEQQQYQEQPAKESKLPSKPLSRTPTQRLLELSGRNNRNSVHYMDGAPDAIVVLEKNLDTTPVLDEDEDDVEDISREEDSADDDDDDDSLSVASSELSPRS
ncbi:hypothetical protein BGW37DRAFT_510215 [Umbelopsis sp. PMI_123]|nr:hypothetical protein BGW37DRAFT_510215 [Umbelopsis sp. PMI_123]